MEKKLKRALRRPSFFSDPVPGEGFVGPQELFFEQFADVYDFSPINTPENTGIAKVRVWIAENCQFLQTENDSAILRRKKARAADAADLVFVRRFRNCHLQATMDDIALSLEPDRFYLSDEELPVTSFKSAGRMEGLMMPKALLGYTSGHHAPFIDFSEHPIRAAALHIELDHMFASLNARNVLDLGSFNRFVACVKTAIRSPHQDRDVRRQARDALSDVIRLHIERELDSPDLSVSTVLKTFGVSRASLYRMFEADGGVRQYVSNRRLYRAVVDLTERPLSRGDITSVSGKWGFSSAPNFNRAVRRQFGVAPSELINLSNT